MVGSQLGICNHTHHGWLLCKEREPPEKGMLQCLAFLSLPSSFRLRHKSSHTTFLHCPSRRNNQCCKMSISLDKVVLVDMDNTLVDFDLEFGKRWVAARPDDTLDLIKERKHFELEQNFSADLKPLAIEIMSQPGFFISFQPQLNAVEAIKEMTDAGLHVLLCTAPLPFQYETCVAEKFAWVRKHLGVEFLSRIIITRDKTVIKGKVLIDDKPKIAGACPKPEWTHIVFDQPYNRDVVGRDRLSNWSNWRSVIKAYIDF